VIKILESPACCYMDCDDNESDNDDDDDSCPATAVRCSQVGLNTVNATYNATCRFAVNTVTSSSLINDATLSFLKLWHYRDRISNSTVLENYSCKIMILQFCEQRDQYLLRI